MEEQVRQLEARLARAERELTVFRRIGRGVAAGALGLVVAVLLFAATRSDAEKAELSAAAKRGTRIKAPLTVVDRQGRPVMQVVATDEARGVLLFDAAGKLITAAGQTPAAKGVAVYAADGKVQVGVGETSNGHGMAVFDAAGQTVTWTGLGNPGPDGGRGMLVRDSTGARVARFGQVTAEDRGEIIIQDRAGNTLFQQP
jgi:hypothetical protein